MTNVYPEEFKEFEVNEIALNYVKKITKDDNTTWEFEVYGKLKVSIAYGTNRTDYMVMEERDGQVEVFKFNNIYDLVDFCKLRPLINHLKETTRLVHYDNFWVIRDDYGRVIFTLKMVGRHLHVKYLNRKPKVYKKFFMLAELYIGGMIYNNDYIKAMAFYKSELLFKYPMLVKFKETKYRNERCYSLFEVYNYSGHCITNLVIRTSMYHQPTYTYGPNIVLGNLMDNFAGPGIHKIETLNIPKMIEESNLGESMGDNDVC